MADQDFTIQIFDDEGRPVRPESQPASSSSSNSTSTKGNGDGVATSQPIPGPPPTPEKKEQPTSVKAEEREPFKVDNSIAEIFKMATGHSVKPIERLVNLLGDPTNFASTAPRNTNTSTTTVSPNSDTVIDAELVPDVPPTGPQPKPYRSRRPSLARRRRPGGPEDPANFSATAPNANKTTSSTSNAPQPGTTTGQPSPSPSSTTPPVPPPPIPPTPPTPLPSPSPSPVPGGLGNTLGALAGPLAVIAVALPVLVDLQRRRQAIHNAYRYDANTPPGEFIQENIGGQARKQLEVGTSQMDPVSGYVVSYALEPLVQGIEVTTDAFARVSDITYKVETSLRGLANSVKPFEENIAKQRALNRVDTKLLEIERAQTLGPEAAENLKLQQELYREFNMAVNQIAKPALNILNQVFDFLITTLGPFLVAMAKVVEMILVALNQIVTMLKIIYDNSPAGSILNAVRDIRNYYNRRKRREAAQNQVDFFELGQVSGFNSPPKPPENRGPK